jgi:hypothetical protein
MPDRLTIRRPEEGDEGQRGPGSSLKFRLVQILVLVVAILFADGVMMEGRIRRELGRGISGIVADGYETARELLAVR